MAYRFSMVFFPLLITTFGVACGGTEGATPPPAPGPEAGMQTDAGATPDAGTVLPPPCPASGRALMRLVAGNLTSGNDQSYTPGEGGRIFKALAPDVAMIQEFNVGSNSTDDLGGFVRRYFGPSHTYTRSTVADGAGAIPNAVISRWPIVESGSWVDPEISNRSHSWAKILLPGGKTLLAISVHLKAGSASSTRVLEAKALLRSLETVRADYMVVGGDFNTSSQQEQVVTTLAAAFDPAAPYPEDEDQNANTSANRGKPYDWVLPTSTLRTLEVPATLAGKSFAHGLVFDTRVFSAVPQLSAAGDADAVRSTDSAAANMQHMAVLRSFELSCAP